MKVFYFLVLIAFIYEIESNLFGFTNNKTCSEYYGYKTRKTQAYSYDFCRTLRIDSGYDRCCFMKVKCNNSEYYYNCAPITLAQYYDIKNTIKTIESNYSIGIRSLYCSSSFLSVSILLILVFLL